MVMPTQRLKMSYKTLGLDYLVCSTDLVVYQI
jgi:hypothetical protein